jgi:hypothetical protein
MHSFILIAGVHRHSLLASSLIQLLCLASEPRLHQACAGRLAVGFRYTRLGHFIKD